MKALLIATSLTIGLFAAAAVHAQVPAGAPAGTTGLCKDGSYSSSDSKRGACRGHKGVKEWYAADTAAAAASKTATTEAAPPKTPAKTTTAAAPAGAAPAGSTGLCKDGTYTDTDTKRGACRGHKGVQDWYGATTAATAPAAKPMAPAPTPAPMPAPKATSAAAPAAPAATGKKQEELPATPAAGGGPGKVWVNTSTKVYHCSSDRYYGKTKEGAYMTEADAVAKGNHASHGKACSG